MSQWKKRYPELVVDLSKLKNNIDRVKAICDSEGVEVAGIIKAVQVSFLVRNSLKQQDADG